MLKHCVETLFGNKGEGLLQVRISSQYIIKYFQSSFGPDRVA